MAPAAFVMLRAMESVLHKDGLNQGGNELRGLELNVRTWRGNPAEWRVTCEDLDGTGFTLTFAICPLRDSILRTEFSPA